MNAKIMLCAVLIVTIAFIQKISSNHIQINLNHDKDKLDEIFQSVVPKVVTLTNRMKCALHVFVIKNFVIRTWFPFTPKLYTHYMFRGIRPTNKQLTNLYQMLHHDYSRPIYVTEFLTRYQKGLKLVFPEQWNPNDEPQLEDYQYVDQSESKNNSQCMLHFMIGSFDYIFKEYPILKLHRRDFFIRALLNSMIQKTRTSINYFLLLDVKSQMKPK